MNKEIYFILEGIDDKLVLEHILFKKFKSIFINKELLNLIHKGEKYGIKFMIEHGRDNLMRNIRARILSEVKVTKAIIYDANDTLEDSWKSLKNSLKDYDFSFPTKPAPDGTILISPEYGTLGIWVMPNNSLKGYLEDFLISAIKSDDQLFPFAKKTVEQVKQMDQRFKDNDLSKAELYTWLAWQADPGKRFGTAVKAGFFDMENSQIQPFIQWLYRLFESHQPEE